MQKWRTEREGEVKEAESNRTANFTSINNKETGFEFRYFFFFMIVYFLGAKF